MGPSGVNMTTEGSSRLPSEPGMTRGWSPSMEATRLLVVPRSIPITRDMGSLCLCGERLVKIIQNAAKVGAMGHDAAHFGEEARFVGLREADLVDGVVPAREQVL